MTLPRGADCCPVPPQAAAICRIYRISRGGTPGRRTKKGVPHRNSFIKDGRRLTFPQTSAVSSAMAGLTSLFGMGRGGHRLYSHPNQLFDIRTRHIREIECVVLSIREFVNRLRKHDSHILEFTSPRIDEAFINGKSSGN